MFACLVRSRSYVYLRVLAVAHFPFLDLRPTLATLDKPDPLLAFSYPDLTAIRAPRLMARDTVDTEHLALIAVHALISSSSFVVNNPHLSASSAQASHILVPV